MMRISSLLWIVLVVTSGFSQTEPKQEVKPIPEAEVSTTQQSVKINGVVIPLTAKAGTMKLRDENNEPIALFGFTSYTKDGAANRPIVFSYNGGPGSSSFWLHMGVMGPKRIVVNDPLFTPAAPYKLVNNDFSILDVADVVVLEITVGFGGDAATNVDLGDNLDLADAKLIR